MENKTCYLLHIHKIMFYVLDRAVPSLRISCFYYTVGWYQRNFICFVYRQLVSVKLHDKTYTVVHRVLDDKGVYSQVSISIKFEYPHVVNFESSFYYSLCTECLWLDQGKQFTREKIASKCDMLLSCTIHVLTT